MGVIAKAQVRVALLGASLSRGSGSGKGFSDKFFSNALHVVGVGWYMKFSDWSFCNVEQGT